MTMRRSSVLPHPGPLPLGEGESVAASLKNFAAGFAQMADESAFAALLLPSPSGRGIEGEGERVANT